MRLSKKAKQDMLKMAKSKKIRKAAQELDDTVSKIPPLTPIQYIRWLDEYQRAFGQFPVSQHKIKVKKFLL